MLLYLQVYEGEYYYETMEAVIKSENNQLLLTTSGQTVVLAFKEPLRFQV